MALAATAVGAGLTACSPGPDVPPPEAGLAPPRIVPLDPIIATARPDRITPEVTAVVAARGEALRRAAQTPVPATMPVAGDRATALRARAAALKARTD